VADPEGSRRPRSSSGTHAAAACSADGNLIKDPDHDSVRKQSMTYVVPVALIDSR